MAKSVRFFLLTILFSYLGLALYAYWFAEEVIFQPPPSAKKDTYTFIKLKAKDGATISALHLPNPDARYTLLFSHGNAEYLDVLYHFLEAIRDMGFSVFAYDYHGYGTSSGRASERNTYIAINAAYDYLVNDLNVDPKHIIAHGRSLGGAVAADLAARQPLGGLVLESTFVSAYRVMTKVPLLPFDQFQTLAKIKQVKCPVLIIHGKEDEIIPFWHGQALLEHANAPKYSAWIDGAHHNDVYAVAPEQYQRVLKEFEANLLWKK